MNRLEFYICKDCGNIIVKVKDSKVPVVCCGENMSILEAGTTDAALEKHIPVVTEENGKATIQVGSVEHPMEEEHYIEFIVVEYENGFQIKYLKPHEKPTAIFLIDSKILTVYEHCNIHGLWKTDLN